MIDEMGMNYGKKPQTIADAVNMGANAVKPATTTETYVGTGLNPFNTKTTTPTTGGTSKKSSTPTKVTIPDQWQSGYAPSQNVLDAQNYLQKQQAALEGLGEYNGSPYDQDIANAYSAIMNRGPFSYNVNDDALYQMYRNLYAENGKQASLNAQGQAAALTGGYGNSYGAAAGAAAYDQYMTQLNDRALDLYDRAYQRWGDEGNRQLQNLNTATGMADRDYNYWNDAYNRALNERNTAYDMYGTDWARDYQLYNDQMTKDYNLAIAMIKAGVTPTGQMLRNAGISEAELKKLQKTYKKSKSSGGSGGTKKTGIEAVYDYIDDMVNSGNLSKEDAISMAQALKGQSTTSATKSLSTADTTSATTAAKTPTAGKEAKAAPGSLLEAYKNIQKKNN